MGTRLIIGNIIALIGSLGMVYCGTLKNKKNILFAQTLSISMFVLSGTILSAKTGIIINAINVQENILCYKEKLGKKEKIIITILAVSLPLYFNDKGILGLLPVVSIVTYTWLMNIKEIKKFKLLIMSTTILWFIYDTLIKSYTSALFGIATFTSNMITYFKIKNKEKNTIKENIC